MPLPPQAGVFSMEVRLQPGELVAAWRPDSRRLVLQAREPVKAQQRVAARIAVAGREQAATITGRAASVSRHQGACVIELAPDELRLRALERLLAVARGEAVAGPQRIPRWLATLPAIVHGPAGPIYMTTFSISENGCGLVWSGAVPAAMGARLDLRLGAGSRSVTFHGTVCWISRSGSVTTVGVRFVRGARDAWALMLADTARAGAPPA